MEEEEDKCVEEQEQLGTEREAIGDPAHQVVTRSGRAVHLPVWRRDYTSGRGRCTVCMLSLK
jgi:hypothetical protein